MSGQILSTRGFDRIVARLMKARTPSARLYAKYRDSADAYVRQHSGHSAVFRLPDNREIEARLDFRPSILFGRDYLVAWFDDGSAFGPAMPDMDAITSPIAVPWSSFALPIIVASESRRRSRRHSFVSIIEHETVHVNQAMLGSSFPEFAGGSVTELLRCFFVHTQLEYEAHFIQHFHWPPRLRLETPPEFDQWVLLRAYTPAIEQILRAAARHRIPAGTLPSFLNRVPKEAANRLRPLGCRAELAPWFRARWATDVFTALQIIGSQGVDPRCPPLQVVWNWLRTQVELHRQSARA